MQPSVEDRPPWWLWPTILSLDAPAVVLLWQWLIARSVAQVPSAAEAAVLASSVWLAYAADRWIEGWRLSPGAIRTHRHRFHQRWRWPIAAAWAAVLGLDLTLALCALPRVAIAGGLVVLVPVIAYILSHQFVHRDRSWRPPKEACVAALLGAGSVVFVAGRPGVSPGGLAVPLALFALLCFSNCALISVWEDEVDRSHGQTSLALQFVRAAELSRRLPWIIAAASLVAWVFVPRAEGPAAACAAASGLLLGLVDRMEARAGRVLARVLADVALMTPALPLLVSLLQ